MSEQGQFDLCPKCGAVARDGICQSCGYEIPGIQDAMEQTTIEQTITEQTITEPAAAQQTDNGLYTMPDVYETQTGQDVYQTPDMSTGHHDTGGLFSGDHAGENAALQQNTYDGSGQYNGQYGNNNPYGGGSQYNGGQYGNANNQYNGGQYGNANNQYNGGQYGNANNQYGNGQYQYGNNQYGNNQYNNQQYGNQQYGNPYGPNPYVNNPYSPYAVPPATKHTGLIIGVIIAVAILFLFAVLAVFYHLLEAAVEGREVSKEVTTYVSPEDNQDDDNKKNPDDRHRDDDIDVDDDDIDDDDADNNDDDDIYYDDDEYYTLQDDIKNGLSYSIKWDYYEYEPDDSDVAIFIDYPIIVGSHVPNLDKINEVLAEEVSVFTEYYEDEYSAYMDEDSYFYASATGYVTYMSEDVLSVVFSEYIYSDYYDSVYCYSINIDMEDGVIMDNTDIIAVDDDFSIDFRYRSEEQNGTIDTLDWMSDQEITELLTSAGNLIIYYTPMGMEIGFNYDDGWVTVTYHDYKNYLKIF